VMSYMLRKLELIQATIAMCGRLEADKLVRFMELAAQFMYYIQVCKIS
jgi:hypothetical protein